MVFAISIWNHRWNRPSYLPIQNNHPVIFSLSFPTIRYIIVIVSPCSIDSGRCGVVGWAALSMTPSFLVGIFHCYFVNDTFHFFVPRYSCHGSFAVGERQFMLDWWHEFIFKSSRLTFILLLFLFESPLFNRYCSERHHDSFHIHFYSWLKLTALGMWLCDVVLPIFHFC